MLRIYFHDEVPVTSFVLEGKLVGPWVKELEKYWSALATNASRTILVDLADVSFIDSEGRALLGRMRRKGVRLLSAGVLIDAIVAEIDAEQRKHSAECAECSSFNHEREKSQAYQSHDVNTEGASNG